MVNRPASQHPYAGRSRCHKRSGTGLRGEQAVVRSTEAGDDKPSHRAREPIHRRPGASGDSVIGEVEGARPCGSLLHNLPRSSAHARHHERVAAKILHASDSCGGVRLLVERWSARTRPPAPEDGARRLWSPHTDSVRAVHARGLGWRGDLADASLRQPGGGCTPWQGNWRQHPPSNPSGGQQRLRGHFGSGSPLSTRRRAARCA